MGGRPFSLSGRSCLRHMKQQAETVRNSAIVFLDRSSAAAIVNGKESDTMHVTGGTLEVAVSLSLLNRSLNGAIKLFLIASASARFSHNLRQY
jgi:hypothetical protein